MSKRVTTTVTLSLPPSLSAASISEVHASLADSAFVINSAIRAPARCLVSPSVQSSSVSPGSRSRDEISGQISLFLLPTA